MKIAIFGAGALGGYFGARLQQAGHSLHYIARGAHLDALRSDGLTINSKLGDATLEVDATDDPATIGPVDYVFFLTKLQDTEAAAQTLGPMLGDNTTIATFQNGIDGARLIGNVVGAGRVIGGSSYISAEVISPGVIRHNSDFAKLVYGELDGSMSDRVTSLDDALSSAGIVSEPVANVHERLWTKFVFLSALSGVTALTRLSIGELLEDPETSQLYIAALNESAAIGMKDCPSLSPDVATDQLNFSKTLPFQMRASMLDDLERGKPLELEYLSGAVVRLAEQYGMEVPVHRMIGQALNAYKTGKAPTKA